MAPVLEVREVFKAYGGFALKDVTFSLPGGFIMGLIGPNGAGKTTLMKMALDLVRPDAGEILAFGEDVRNAGPGLKARIGFVHEEPRFYRHLSVEGNARALGAFYPGWDQASFLRMAEEFGLPREAKIKTLSHGNRTRFALAMALSHGAKLLLLDEPSSGLDPAFRRELLERLSGIREGGEVSVLFSTHITSDLDRVADYITFLRNGRIHFSLTREEVLESYALVRGDPGLLNERIRELFEGIVVGELGFTGLTRKADEVRSALAGKDHVIDRATLEDVVYYTGRTGEGGVSFHAE